MKYITLRTIKRDLGFKGIETNDLVLGIPLLMIFLLLISCTPLKLFSIIFLIVSIFLMLPIKVSKKNRMYKVLFMIIQYIFRIKTYIYVKRGDCS